MKKKRGSGEDVLGAGVDIKSLIDEHSGFFDKLVELIPAKFYLPVDDKDKVWYPGLSKEEKALAKKESKENIRKARRDRMDPEKSSASTLDLLKQNLEKENSSGESDDDEEEVEINPKLTTGGLEDDGDSKSVTYEELRERLRRKIEELRAGRNADGLETPRKVQRNDRRKIHEKKRKRESVPESGASSGNVEKEVAEAAKELEFSHVKLANDEEPGKGKKKRKISKLKELEKAKELAAAKKDPEKGAVVAQKHAWETAMSRAAGVKVHDNPKLIARSLKKEKKRQQKNAEKWKDRVDTQHQSKAEKQQKRSKNIQKRVEEKKKRKIQKREKKLMRPGFEGRKEVTQNQQPNYGIEDWLPAELSLGEPPTLAAEDDDRVG